MKKLLLSGCIIFGCVTCASAQAADAAVPVTSRTPSTSSVKSTISPKVAADNAATNAARGSKTKPATKSAVTTKGQAVKPAFVKPTAASAAAKQN